MLASLHVGIRTTAVRACVVDPRTVQSLLINRREGLVPIFYNLLTIMVHAAPDLLRKEKFAIPAATVTPV